MQHHVAVALEEPQGRVEELTVTLERSAELELDAALLDLDGVITPTAEVQALAGHRVVSFRWAGPGSPADCW